MTKKIRLTRPGSNVIRDSDRKIEKALKSLSAHHRGQQSLSEMKAFLQGAASGLDLSEASEMMLILREFFIGHRRDFLAQIEKPKKS